MLAFLSFLLISIFLLRGIVFSPSFIGFNHDWGFPMTNDSLRLFCYQSFYLWNVDNCGHNVVYPSDDLLRYSLLPLSLLGISGLVAIKLILVSTFLFGGYFMYLLLKESFKLEWIPSFIAGFFYIITPVFFNKTVAGHVAYIIGYALSPLIMLYLIKYVDTIKARYSIIAGFLIAFASIQLQFAIMLGLLFFFYAIFVARMKLNLLAKTLSLILLIFFSVHSFWILPLITNTSFSERIQLASNAQDLETWNTPLTDAFRMIGYRSPHFETVVNGSDYRYAWDICSFSLVILIFCSLLIRKSRITLFFGSVSIVALIFTTGLSGPFGILVYFLFSIFPGSNLFRELYHLTFLISFSYSVMLAYFLQAIHNSRKTKGYMRIILMTAILIIVILYDPFIYSGDFSGQIQEYRFDNQSLALVDEYMKSNGDYRVLYAPMVQPLRYDHLAYDGIDPMIAYSEKPTIGNYVDPDFLKLVALFSYLPSSNLTNVLKILSVRYVFFRNNYQSMVPSYLDEGRLEIGGETYDIRPIWTNTNLLETLMNQQDLNLTYQSENLLIFENKNYLPHIYPANVQILVNGSDKEMFDLLLSANISKADNPAIFLSNQLSKEQLNLIMNYSTVPVVTFSKINPTKYEVKIENATGPFFLVFGENYDPYWKIYTTDEKLESSEAIERYDFTPKDIFYLFSKPLENEYHFAVNGYANAWYVNPAQIDKNGDGEFSITIYYLPQSLFYLGFIISGTTFIACMVYLVYDWKYKKA